MNTRTRAAESLLLFACRIVTLNTFALQRFAVAERPHGPVTLSVQNVGRLTGLSAQTGGSEPLPPCGPSVIPSTTGRVEQSASMSPYSVAGPSLFRFSEA